MVLKLLYKKKKGISEVIITLLMVGLVVAAFSVIAVVVNNIVKKNVQSSESCFGNFGKVSLDSKYICYNNIAKTLQFSLQVGDIDTVQKIVVSVLADNKVAAFTLNQSGRIIDLENFGSNNGFGTDIISLPGKNEGKSYVTNFSSIKPNSIKIAPVIKGQQCDFSDTVNEIDYC